MDTVRLSQDQRNKLLKIRKNTGIRNWNVLCRWALCYSLAENSEPVTYIKGGKTGIEMDWETFTGKDAKVVFDTLLSYLGEDKFYSHIQRGIDTILNKQLGELLQSE